MSQLRDKWEGHDASLEGFPVHEVFPVFLKLGVLLGLDDALVDEDLRHPHGAAPRRLLSVDDVVPRPDLLEQKRVARLPRRRTRPRAADRAS